MLSSADKSIVPFIGAQFGTKEATVRDTQFAWYFVSVSSGRHLSMAYKVILKNCSND